MVNYISKKIEFSHTSSRFFILLIFIAIIVSEYIFAFKDVSYGIVLSLFITIAIYVTISVTRMEGDFVNSAESLALIPIYVLFTASLPWFFISQQYLLPAVYSLILALCFWHINERNIDLHELGFRSEGALKYALIGAALAIPTGIIEYIILMPSPSFPSFEITILLRDALYMLLFVALAEELLFRGIIMNDLKKVFGLRTAILAQSAMFGIMHMTWRSSYEIAFTFFAGVLLGYFYYRTRSLVGPIVMHGMNNIILVSLMPYIFPVVHKWFT
ncbi:MAG: type II CAAX endopeptidase family protein [Candidatus Methanoperedens sp.]|nr:type II CAAX endopeptidase family protein [Candidatus Methanoperedens sp.]